MDDSGVTKILYVILDTQGHHHVVELFVFCKWRPFFFPKTFCGFSAQGKKIAWV